MRQWCLFARCRLIEKCTVFGDDVFEQIQVRAHRLQLIQLAAGDQHGTALRGDEALQGGRGFRENLPLGGEGSIVVTAKG